MIFTVVSTMVHVIIQFKKSVFVSHICESKLRPSPNLDWPILKQDNKNSNEVIQALILEENLNKGKFPC